MREMTIHWCGLPVDAFLASDPEEGSCMELDTIPSVPDVSEESWFSDMGKFR